MKALRLVAQFPAFWFVLWAFILCFTSVAIGPDSYLRVDDNGDCAIPARMALASESGPSGLSYWFRYSDCGADRFASSQACHADSIFYLFFPPWLVLGLGLGAQRFVAGYFTYRLVRDHFAISLTPAILSGLLYAAFFQSTINQSQTGFNYCAGLGNPGIPLYLWGLSALCQTRSKLRFLAAFALGSILGATSLFAITIFYYPLLYIWSFIIRPEHRIGYCALLITFMFAWVVVSLPTLIPTLYLAPGSHRADLQTPQAGVGNDYHQFVHLIGNNAIPLCIALVGAFFSKGYLRHAILIVWALLAMDLFLGGFEKSIISSLDQTIGIGFVRGVNFRRVFETVPFLTACAMGLALQSLLNAGTSFPLAAEIPSERKEPTPLEGAHSGFGGARVRKALMGPVAIGICLIWTLAMAGRTIRLQAMAWSRGEAYSALFKIPQLTSLKATMASESLGRLATVVTLEDFEDSYRLQPAFMVSYGFECADGYLNIFPKRYLNYWKEVLRGASSQSSKIAQYKGNRIQLWFPFAPRDWLELPEEARPHFGSLYNLNLLSAANVRYIVSSVPLNDARLEAVFEADREGDVHFASTMFLHPFEYLEQYEKRRRIYIYRNRACLPRCYAAAKTVTLGSTAEVLKTISEASPDELNSTVYLEKTEANPPDTALSGGIGPVEISKWASDEIDVEVDLKSECHLVMVVSYSPYWKAEIDGRPSPVVPANGTFMAVHTTEGKHHVTWRYRPPWFF